eukprot:COSAG06_NODE_69677_length_196_cov_68.865979_1_plen_53_part_01
MSQSYALKQRTFCQDRLGTNTDKRRVFVFSQFPFFEEMHWFVARKYVQKWRES